MKTIGTSANIDEIRDLAAKLREVVADVEYYDWSNVNDNQREVLVELCLIAENLQFEILSSTWQPS